jgi:glycosyltransferase involved in cell wall biosynthesis
MRTILYIIPYLSIGGTEKHLLDLVNGFQDQYQLFLLAPPGETLEQFTQRRIAYYPFPRLDQSPGEGLRKFFHHIKRITRENKIDLIHIHGAPELMLLTRMAVRKIPIVFTVHGFHGEMKSFDYWLCTRLCNWFAAKVIAVAKAEEKILLEKRIRPGLVQTILNGVPDPLKLTFNKPSPLLNLPPDRVLIGAIARLETTKGINYLIQAFAALAPQFPKLHLAIVGTGSKEAELKEQASQLGINDRITFTGYQQNVHDYLHYFTIFVIPSLHEAHPLVLMEGMGHGKAIIATTVGGIPEVIDNGQNGLLVPPAQPEALATALRRLLTGRELAADIGGKSRQSYEKEFTVERMLEETKKVYNSFEKANESGNQ